MTPSFLTPAELEQLPTLSEGALNDLDYGVVKVDDAGVIGFYNDYEAELAGIEPEDAEGKNFFTQVAPCTNNRLFFGRFREGVEEGELNAAFPYTFTYKLRPTLVDIHLYRTPGRNENWVLVKKK